MKPDSKKIEEIAGDTGFIPETVEKVLRLTSLLSEIESHPFLSEKLVLKGGTAIHLFWLDGKRLSVDLDFNYIGAVGKKEMLEEKPKLEEALQRLCTAQGYTTQRIPTEHAGGKWRLRYTGYLNQPQILEVDVNYLFRVPIWGVEKRNLHCLGFSDIKSSFSILHPLELWGGKIAAAVLRAEPRDLFDLLFIPKSVLKSKNLRRTAILLGSGSRDDWRETKTNRIVDLKQDQIHQRLYPVVRAKENVNWSGLPQKIHTILKPFFRLRKNEKQFLEFLEEKGEYKPKMLFPEAEIAERLQHHPLFLWKAQNRKEFLLKKK